MESFFGNMPELHISVIIAVVLSITTITAAFLDFGTPPEKNAKNLIGFCVSYLIGGVIIGGCTALPTFLIIILINELGVLSFSIIVLFASITISFVYFITKDRVK